MTRRHQMSGILLLFAILGGAASHGEAAVITYSWSGRIQSYDSSSPDPWSLGDEGATFVWQTSVARDANDTYDNEIPFAIFKPSAIRLWIAGEEAIALPEYSAIDFSDASSDLSLDVISVGGTFTWRGEAINVGSVVGLHASTFAFAREIETLPVFASTTSSRGASAGQPYLTIVESGTDVVVTPEPIAFWLGVAGTCGMASGLRRRRGASLS